MPFGPDHLKIKADLWLFFEKDKKAKCCTCNKTETGTFTCVNVVVFGCNKFLAGRMCEECYPRMRAAWERNGMIIEEQKPPEVASTGTKDSEQ